MDNEIFKKWSKSWLTAIRNNMDDSNHRSILSDDIKLRNIFD